MILYLSYKTWDLNKVHYYYYYYGWCLDEMLPSLRASSPSWASEACLARTRERAAKPREAEERRACNDLL